MLELSGHAWVQGLINGVTLGWIYILLALGLTLIMSLMNIMQFAHGEIYMVGAYIAYFLAVKVGINIFLSMLISMAATAILGLLLERLVFRPLLDNPLPSICAATGLMLVLQTLVILTSGLAVKHFPNLWPGVVKLGGWIVPRDRLLAVAISLALTLFLYLLLKRTKYGQAIVASAQSRKGAVLQGIDPNRMSALVMAIGSAFAAVGGVLAGGIFMLSPYMGTAALVKGILIIVLGGMGSLLGVVVGGIILGLNDSLVQLALGPAPSVIVPLLVIIVILVIRPQGLFGHE